MTVFFLAGVGWRKLGNGDSAPRDLNGLAFRGSLEQFIEVSFGVERTDGFHVGHYLIEQTSRSTSWFVLWAESRRKPTPVFHPYAGKRSRQPTRVALECGWASPHNLHSTELKRLT